jgi:hypothetical protein
MGSLRLTTALATETHIRGRLLSFQVKICECRVVDIVVALGDKVLSFAGTGSLEEEQSSQSVAPVSEIFYVT